MTPSLSKKPFPSLDPESLLGCIHCGLCLGSCPTYQLTGDENNSPRGRLAHWRAIQDGRLVPGASTDFYMDECVGCLACETACPAQVPYGEILHQVRRQRVADGKPLPWWIRLAARAVQYPKGFSRALLPARLLRRAGFRSAFLFPGEPAVFGSSAQYAKEMMTHFCPTGPIVALQTGCLMEALFREINFATIRVLMAHNIRVMVPESQTCCGAFLEHTGVNGVDQLFETNRSAFDTLGVDAVITNSAGCGLSMKHALKTPALDIHRFLAEIGVRQGRGLALDHIYVDLPCHLVHGQREPGIPESVLKAIGTPWSLAPMATDCCGSGGVYHKLKPENAREILKRKSAFLDESAYARIALATSNHVCLMQWHSTRAQGLVSKTHRVAHIVQLLDESLSPLSNS